MTALKSYAKPRRGLILENFEQQHAVAGVFYFLAAEVLGRGTDHGVVRAHHPLRRRVAELGGERGGTDDIGQQEGHALRLASPSGQIVVVEDPQLQWPDGLARGPQDWAYLTVNQLNLHPALNRGHEESRPPYEVFRVRVPAGPPAREPRTAVQRPADAGTEASTPTAQ